MRRSSAPSGSWKTICMRARSARQAGVPGAGIGRPSKATVPASGTSMPSTMRPVVDFPQPDSPTSPKVRPRSNVSETPATAVTSTLRPNNPRRIA